MKSKKKLFALLMIFIASTVCVRAQKVIKEGIVTYSVSYDIPADQLQNYSTLPTEVIIYFRGDSSAAIVNQGSAIIKGVTVFKANYHSMIIDIPVMAKKFFVELSAAEVAEEKASNPQLTGKPGTEQEVINGYKCVKTIVTDTKSGASFDIWLTNDVDIAPNSLSKLVSAFGGVPIRFVTFNRGIKISAELEGIEETVVPPGFFSPTKEYQHMTFTELKNLSGEK
jgi:hypothetical protein